jgi:hypothetical protein
VVCTFDPATGVLRLVQEFTARLGNGKANAVRVKDGAVADGPVTFAPPGTGDYAGGGFVLALAPGLDRREFCARVQAGADLLAVDARKVGDRTVLAFAGTTSGKDDPFWSRNAAQADGPPHTGFFCVAMLK